MDGINCFDLVLTDRDSKKKYKNIFCKVNKIFDEIIKYKQNYLHADELSYFDTLTYAERQKSYLLGRCGAKAALIKLHSNLLPTDIWIGNGVFDFPYVVEPNMVNSQISISHTADSAVAIAYTESHPMAVDIEEINSARNEVIRSQLNASELAIIDKLGLDTSKGLTLMWTAKEALSKVLKCGLLIDFKFLEVVELSLEADKYMIYYKNFPQYKAIAFELNSAICCLVFPEKTELTCDLLK